MTSLLRYWRRAECYYWLMVGNLLPLFVTSL